MLVWGVPTDTTAGQKLAVLLAFVAAALSFTALALGYSRTGAIDSTPLFGGLFMLALGLGGYFKIRRPPD
jgi:drug/metabolite transporter (DMT)-like permease